jgi:glyoxylase-like metal-dependent hydrolase (beta-lactamase superfamily II)
MHKISTLNLGMLSTNCFIVSDENNDCVAIDIGGSSDKFIAYIKENNLNLKAILLTHGHFDHMMGVGEVQREYDIPVYIHKSDVVCFKNPRFNVSYIVGNEYTADIKNIIEIDDNDTINISNISNLRFRVIHTPGHTKGSVCYDMGDDLFTGDTIFKGSWGRTDFPGGDIDELISSLLRLKNLDGDRNIYSGHSEVTTLETERNANPYMRRGY